MTILVTGATGRVGRHVVDQLVQRGAKVRVLTRDPAKANVPAGVEVAQGDLLDIDAVRNAFQGVRTLFLLNAVTGDEFTQAIITLNLAREAGVERVVYLSVIHADRFVNVPHFAVKSGAERMLEQMGFSATILRPTYFIDNEWMIKDAILQLKVTPTITADGRVFLNMDVQKDDLSGFVNTGVGQVPQLATRQVTTSVLVDDGQTVVIGGVYEFKDQQDLSKVPFLADLPVIGNLFKKRGRTKSKAELLIMVTPKVIRVAQRRD